MIFRCPSCKYKKWLPAKIRWYYSEKLKQNIQSEIPHCYKCKRRMLLLLKNMQ